MAEVKLEDVPRKVRDLYDKGFAALERGNLDYAMDLLLSALDLEPRLLQARKFLRAAELKKNKDKKNSALSHKLSTLTGMGGMAKVSAMINKDPIKAVRVAEDLLRKDPLNLTFVKCFGRAAVAAELPEAAVQMYEIARDHYPKDVELLNLMGQLYIDVGDPSKARGCFEEVSRLRPNDQVALKALKDAAALDTMKKGRWETGRDYRDMIKDSKEATLLEQEGKAVKTSKDVDALIQDTRGKIQREPDNVNYRRALADLLVKADRYDEAVQALEEAQKVAGGADPQIDQMLSRIKLKQFDAEIQQLKKDGDEAGLKAKQQAKADFQLEDARDRVTRYPNDLQFKYDLGLLLYERGELNEAIQQFQQAQRNPQRRIKALYYLALCFKDKEQYDIAMEQFEKARSELHTMDKTKKDVLYEMGTAAEAMGDQEKAAEYYKEIYAVDIGYRDVAEKIEKAYKK
jgi:tetratricopeptide (TPR) repeat protein